MCVCKTNVYVPDAVCQVYEMCAHRLVLQLLCLYASKYCACMCVWRAVDIMCCSANCVALCMCVGSLSTMKTS